MNQANDESFKVIGFGFGWIVIDKKHGMSVHNDPGTDAVSISQNRISKNPDLLLATTGRPQADADFKLYPVHRLDRETSGCLLLATRRDTAAVLHAEFSEHQNIKKTYRAILQGSLINTKSESADRLAGEWNWPLTDQSEGRGNISGPIGLRKNCVTRFKILKQNKYFSEAEIQLETGRQHQIRKHAALSGHAVAGETRYADPRHARRLERLYGISRLLLHAEKLELNCSHLGIDKIEVQADVPLEFVKVFSKGDL